MGCHFLLQGISQSRDQGRVSCIGRWILYHLSHLGSPSKLHPLLQAACSFIFQNNSLSPIPAKSTKWGFLHLLWGPGLPLGGKSHRSVGPLGISILETCPHWAFHGSSLTAQFSLPYHWLPPGLCLWVSTPVSCDSLYLPLGLCSLGGHSLPCDLTSLTGLRRLIGFQYAHLCTCLSTKSGRFQLLTCQTGNWKSTLSFKCFFPMFIAGIYRFGQCLHASLATLLNSFMTTRRVIWRWLWILYVDNHVMSNAILFHLFHSF